MAGDPSARTAPLSMTLIGRLGRSFQLEGGLHFRGLGSAEEDLLGSVDQLFVVGFGIAKLRDVRWPGGAPVIYLSGVRDRNAARALTNADVYADAVAAEAARASDPDASLERDLIGLPVVLLRDGAAAGDEITVGTVKSVSVGGSNDLIELATADGVTLLPLAAPYVRIEPSRVVLLDPPAGLL